MSLRGALATMAIALLIVSLIILCTVWWCLNKKRRNQGLNAPRNRHLDQRSRRYESARIEYDGQVPPDGFDDFIESVIDIFNQQRIEGDQFAVLLLIPRGRDLRDIQVENYFQATNSQQPVINPRCPCCPAVPTQFYNYLVARPAYRDRCGPQPIKIHAEQVIMEKFQQESLNNYLRQEGSLPEYIILYSWLMPCKDCVDILIEKFTSLKDATGIELIVAYTSDWIEEAQHISSASKYRLRRTIRTLKRVQYPKDLPKATTI